MTKGDVHQLLSDIAEARAGSYAKLIDVRRATVDVSARDFVAHLAREDSGMLALIVEAGGISDEPVTVSSEELKRSFALFETTGAAVKWLRSQRAA